MDKEFFPNACFICSATKNLKRCSRCQMISYCGEEHQKEHWPDHKDLCTTIFIMMRERRVSHLYEKLKGSDLHTWRKETMSIMEEAEARHYPKIMDTNDAFMFQFSRSCYVCHESRQALLKNCPGCPTASFCKEHPSSPVHDIDCANLGRTLEIGVKLSQRIEKHGLIQTQMLLTSVLHAIKYSTEPLVSMEDFLAKFTTSKNLALKIEDDLKFWLSQMYSTILSTFNALQKLEMSTRPKLTIYMQNQDDCEGTDLWEALLHLLPELRELKILFVDPLCRLGFKRRQIDLCRECKKKDKKLTLGFLASSYDACMSGNIQAPDILIHTDICDSETTDYSERKMVPGLLELWSRFHCPLVTTTLIVEYHEQTKNSIRAILGNVDFFFEGYNPFAGFLTLRNNYNRAGMTNQFMIILKAKQ